MNSLRIGRGCQVAGLVLIVLTTVLVGSLQTRPRRDWHMAPTVSCQNNLKQIGLSLRTWAIDNDGQFPFNVSTNAGGTREPRRRTPCTPWGSSPPSTPTP